MQRVQIQQSLSKAQSASCCTRELDHFRAIWFVGYPESQSLLATVEDQHIFIAGQDLQALVPMGPD
jgi:hypothetical protein